MMAPRTRRYWLYAGAAVGAAAVGGAAAWWGGARGGAAGVLPEDTLWAQQWTALDGSPLPMEGLRGRPTVVNFWATWCPPCVGEMPDIQRMYAKYGDKVHFVIVNIDGTKPDVTAFMENHAFSFPVALDTNGSAASAYAVQAIPTSYIIDADSNVVDSHIGALSAGDMESFVTSAF